MLRAKLDPFKSDSKRGGDSPQRHAESAWSSALLLYGVIGLAMGAFHWTASPWFVALKQAAATWLVTHGHSWLLAATAPWWVLPNNPLQNDVFSLFDGVILLLYVTGTSVLMGTGLATCMALVAVSLGTRSRRAFHHLAQTLVPLAGAGLFLGLSMVTVSALRFKGFALAWLDELRAALLSGAVLSSLWLAWRGAGQYAAGIRRLAATSCVLAATGLIIAGWILLLRIR